MSHAQPDDRIIIGRHGMGTARRATCPSNPENTWEHRRVTAHVKPGRSNKSRNLKAPRKKRVTHPFRGQKNTSGHGTKTDVFPVFQKNESTLGMVGVKKAATSSTGR